MKKWSLFTFIILLHLGLRAQNPVSWKYSVAKKEEQTYEIHLTAVLEEGWHAYSQTQPATAVPMPTKINFNKNPLVQLVGKVKEVGNMEKNKNESLKTEDWRYAGRVDFVQLVHVKGNAKTNLCGTVVYMVCTNELCLPPASVKFNLILKP
jgi:thiol:disulfide interchange protein DsbD